MPGCIYKDGDPIILFCCPLGAEVVDIVKEAREMINKHIEKEKQNKHFEADANVEGRILC